MGFNWRAAFGGAASAVSNTAGLLITDEVAKMREARMAQYQQAQVADERAYQGQVREEDHTRNLEMMGIKGEQAAAQATMEREQELADMDRKEAFELQKIGLKGQLDPSAPNITTTVNTGDSDARTKKFGEVMGTKDAEMYESTRNAVMGAPAMDEALNVMEAISESTDTGFIPEKLAQAGTIFGTDAGAAMQAWEGTASSMILEQAQKMAGVLSETDMKIVINGTPKFGNDPKANKVVIGIMRKGLQRSIENKQSMDKWLENNPNLYGWEPPNQQGVNQSPAAQTNMDAADDPLGLFGG